MNDLGVVQNIMGMEICRERDQRKLFFIERLYSKDIVKVWHVIS